MTSFIALPITVERVFTCDCGWFRELVAHPTYRNRVYGHLIYGVVTHERAALLDIKYHNCKTYRAARNRLPTSWRRKAS